MRQLGVAPLVVTMLMLAGCATPAKTSASGATTNGSAGASPTPTSVSGPVYTITKYFERDYCPYRYTSATHCAYIQVHLDNTHSAQDASGGYGWSIVTSEGERVTGRTSGLTDITGGFLTDFEVSFEIKPTVSILKLQHSSTQLPLPPKTPEPPILVFDTSGGSGYVCGNPKECRIEYASPNLTWGGLRVEVNGSLLPYNASAGTQFRTGGGKDQWVVGWFLYDSGKPYQSASIPGASAPIKAGPVFGVQLSRSQSFPETGTILRFATTPGNATLWEHTW